MYYNENYDLLGISVETRNFSEKKKEKKMSNALRVLLRVFGVFGIGGKLFVAMFKNTSTRVHLHVVSTVRDLSNTINS